MKVKRYEFKQSERDDAIAFGKLLMCASVSIGTAIIASLWVGYSVEDGYWKPVLTYLSQLLLFGLMFYRSGKIGTFKGFTDSVWSCIFLSILVMFVLYRPASKLGIVFLAVMTGFCMWSGVLQKFFSDLFGTKKNINWLPVISVVVTVLSFVYQLTQ